MGPPGRSLIIKMVASNGGGQVGVGKEGRGKKKKGKKRELKMCLAENSGLPPSMPYPSLKKQD